MDLLQAIIIITGLLGHWFIARRDKRGYWFWIIGNLAMIAVSLDKQLYGMVALFLIYTGLSLYAIRHWGRHYPGQPEPCRQR